MALPRGRHVAINYQTVAETANKR